MILKNNPNGLQDLQRFIRKVEKDHFRTDQDTGANSGALLIWNLVRKFADLPELERESLPAYCVTHNTYHIIHVGYGCQRKGED